MPQLRNPARYHILGEHGRGGLGKVSRAHDIELGRDVAIKELLSRSAMHEVRFMREALITARLEHPGIVPVHEAGRWPDGTPFYAMKLVAGRPLRDLLAERKTVDERLTLLHHVIAVADAIAYAHGRNIIHRDLKPGNVIIGDFGETVVIDWGLAKDLSGSEESTTGGGPLPVSRDDNLTSAGTVLGTPAYMAPEQRRGEHVDQRADVYAIGVMLWELCSLEKLPPGDTGQRRRILRRGGIDSDLITIIGKALDADPNRRYQNATALAIDLKAFKAGFKITSRQYSFWGVLAHWTRRHRSLAAALAAGVTLAITGIAFYVKNVTTERDRADEALAHAESARNSAIDATRAQKKANNDLTLKNAELLLTSDPSAAWDALKAYHGPEDGRVKLLRAKALGLGVARVRTSLHKDAITRLQPLTDGTLLSESSDGTIATITRSGDIRILAANATNHNASAWSPERKQLAYACRPHGTCLLDIARGSTDSAHLSDVTIPDSLDFSPNGSQLAVRHGDQIRTWDISSTSGFAPGNFSIRLSNIRWLRYLSNSHIVIATRSKVHTIDVIDGTRLDISEQAASTITANDHAVMIGTKSGHVLRIDAHNSRPTIQKWSVCENAVTSLASTGRLLAYGCQDGTMGIRELYNPSKDVFRYREDVSVTSTAISDNEQYAVFGRQDGSIHIYDRTSENTFHYRGQNTRIIAICGPTTEFPFFASGDDDGYIRIWELPSSPFRSVIRANSPLYDTLHLPDGTIIGIGADPNLYWWKDGQTGTIIAHETGGIGIRQSANLTRFATFGFDGQIIIWKSNPITPMRRLHPGPVTNVVFMNDGESVASAGQDGRLLLWAPNSDAPRILAQSPKPLTNVQLLRRDETLIAAERGGAIWQLNPRLQSPRMTIQAPGASISHLVISDDSQWMAIGTVDGRILLYSTSTWKPLLLLKTEGAIRVIVFSSDMSMISAISEDGFVHLTHLTPSHNLNWTSLCLSARNVRFAPNGTYLAITTNNDGVIFYNPSRDEWHHFPIPKTDIFRGRFSHNGLKYVATDNIGNIRLFDLSGLASNFQLNPL